MKYLPLVWYGIWRKRGRAILILFQILIAFVLFGLLQGMKSGMDAAVNKLSADLYTVQRDTGYAPLPMAHLARIKSVPGVKAVAYEAFLPTTYQDAKQNVLAVATDVESALQVIPGVNVTSELAATLKRTRAGALATVDLAKKYGWKAGDHIALQALREPRKDGAKAWEFDVLGVFDPGEESLAKEFLVINYEYMDEARAGRNGTAQMFYVKVDDPKQAQPVIQAIDQLFKNSPHETRTESLRETAQAQLQSIGDLDFIVRAVVGAVMFALLFSVGAMMMQSLRERTNELAVLKTLGFKDKHIFSLILAEAVTLCVAASLLGLWAAARIIPLAKRFTNFEIFMPTTVFASGAAIAVVLAITVAALPAWRGLRLQIVDALAGR